MHLPYRLLPEPTDHRRGWAMLDGSELQGKSLACLGFPSSCDV
ncbi:hypothetical protein CCUS01_04073 [Colletotrichum cuscutae]|uniref:Uncharacterized protein n=1 Tax=Colletotrichum cuscutae TaxID=1209917 RepID=A0AAI9VCD1_9PEZI|nr:hypothetical protein CCUS01_04073 [Colletotrichum cuscutae]